MRVVGETGVSVFPIGLDGSVFGWEFGLRDSADLLSEFCDAGGNFIYTADHFAAGRSEVIVGSWLKQGPRDRVVVATTVGRHPDAAGLSPRMVLRAADASLRRLATDYVDFLTLDADDPDVPIDDTLEAADALQRSGKVRHVAVINHSAPRIRAMRTRADEARYPTVAAIVQEYSLVARRVAEQDLASLVAQPEVGFFARRPLAHGFLTGDIRERSAAGDSPVWSPALEYVNRHGLRVLDALGRVAAEHNVSLARTAAAWAISKPGVTAGVVAARSKDEFLDVMQARQLTLTRNQMAALDDASS